MNEMHRETLSGMDKAPATLRCPEGLVPSSGRRAPEVAVVEAAPRALFSQIALDAASALSMPGIRPRASSSGLLGLVWRAVETDVVPALVAAARARRAW